MDKPIISKLKNDSTHGINTHENCVQHWKMKGGEVMTKYKYSQNQEDSLTITVGRAAEMLNISEYLARQMVKRGELPTIRFGRLIRVPRARLMAMVNSEPNNT